MMTDLNANDKRKRSSRQYYIVKKQLCCGSYDQVETSLTEVCQKVDLQ